MMISMILASCTANNSGGDITPPFYLSNAVIVCDGNSLTFGAFSTHPGGDTAYPQVLNTLYPMNTSNIHVVNKGVNSQTTEEMEADAPTDIDPLLTNTSHMNVLIAWEIGNDLYFHLQSGESAYNTFVNYCLSRKAANPHIKLIVVSNPARNNGFITPAGDNPVAYQAKLTAANDLLIANWPTYADGLINLAQDPRFSSYNTTYFTTADMVHLSDAGYAAVAGLAKDQVLILPH